MFKKIKRLGACLHSQATILPLTQRWVEIFEVSVKGAKASWSLCSGACAHKKIARIARAVQAEQQERRKLLFAAAAEPKRQEEGKAAKPAAAAE